MLVLAVLDTIEASIAELNIRAAFDAGDMERATGLTLEHYARQVLGYLIARLRNRADGEDAFGMFSEDLWNSMAGFRWQCSMRCWAYTLAHNAAVRFARTPGRHIKTNNSASQLAAALGTHLEREDTPQYRRTSVKRAFRELREAFPVEDQTLLMLHVDRGLSFRELAVVTAGGAQQCEATLMREASRLRKRFERIKVELRRMARDRQLFGVSC